jgi:hypothetical protein
MQSVVRGLKISVLEELALKLAKFENEKRAIFQTIVERGGKIVYQDDDSVFFTERKNLVGDFAMTNTKTAPEDERMALRLSPPTQPHFGSARNGWRRNLQNFARYIR